MVRMRQVSFASRNNKIMPQGKNSGLVKLTVTTKGRWTWGCMSILRGTSEDLVLNCAPPDFYTFRCPFPRIILKCCATPLSYTFGV